MKLNPAPTSNHPSLLTVCLALAAVVGAVGAWWVGAIDLPGIVARRIGQARGALSPATLAWLNGLDLRGLLLGFAAICTLAAMIAWRTQAVWHAWLARKPAITDGSKQDSISRHHRIGIVLVCGLAVFARWWPTLANGFFRYDDFDLVVAARDHTWPGVFWLPHGDHFLPLTRAIASVAYGIFGVTAWPYNLGVLLCLWAMLTLACLLLADFGVGRAAQLLFVSLVVLWSPWGEIAAGYYILSSYTLIAALGLAAVWLYRRWRAQGGAFRVAGMALCMGAATLIDISGWYVPPALGVFLWADFAAQEKPRAPDCADGRRGADARLHLLRLRGGEPRQLPEHGWQRPALVCAPRC